MNSTEHPQKARPQPLERTCFNTFQVIPTRWMDVDIYGHVNNVQYLSFFDTAVNSWYIANGLLDPIAGKEIFLVAETSCHYFAELTFPGTVTAGLKIEKIGSSSVVFTVGLFAGQDLRTAAHGRFVHVRVDRITRRPVKHSPETREALSSLASDNTVG